MKSSGRGRLATFVGLTDPARVLHFGPDALAAFWHARRSNMAWTKPILKEIACGMEINMYAPAEDEPVLF
jgi:coenzyme PQQ precursor peptide PqqA